MKANLFKEMEKTRTQAAICDLLLFLLILSGIALTATAEQRDLSWKPILIGALTFFAAVGIILAAKQVLFSREKALVKRAIRRERWEASRNLYAMTDEELSYDFERYFEGKTPSTIRSGRMLDRMLLLEESDSVDQAVETWLASTAYPHIKRDGEYWFAEDGRNWKAIEAATLKGEVIVFERVVAEEV